MSTTSSSTGFASGHGSAPHRELPDRYVHQLGGAAGVGRGARHEGDPGLPARPCKRPADDGVPEHRRVPVQHDPRNDFSFFEEVGQIIQEEPTIALDPEQTGQLAGIGIVHGRPFAPDDDRRAMLDRAAMARAAISRARVYAPRDPGAYYYDGSAGLHAFIGGSYEFLHAGARLLDARTQFHYFATVITPAMTHAQVGAGSAYAFAQAGGKEDGVGDVNGSWAPTSSTTSERVASKSADLGPS